MQKLTDEKILLLMEHLRLLQECDKRWSCWREFHRHLYRMRFRLS
jgi:hypothetical protein